MFDFSTQDHDVLTHYSTDFQCCIGTHLSGDQQGAIYIYIYIGSSQQNASDFGIAIVSGG